MALGALTAGEKTGEQPGTPTFMDLISFAGDDAYPTGGTTTFQATVRAALGRDVEILAVLPQDCGDHFPVYDKTNDTLKVFLRSTGAEAGAAADLSGTTFNLLVIAR